MVFVFTSCYVNLINRPVGALTSKRYAFGDRIWELDFVDSFDPEQELYFPIKLGVRNFQLKRIFPINQSIVSQFSYNWIPDRTRSLFRVFQDSVATTNFEFNFLSSNRVVCSWFYAISVVSKICFSSRSLVIDSYRATLYDSISINSISAYISSYNILSCSGIHGFIDASFRLNVPRILELSNFGSNKFFSAINGNFEGSRNVGQSPIPVFMLGSNPYFFDPLVNYRLKVNSELGRITVRSFFIHGAALSFKCTNNSVGINSLRAFFSGKHLDSIFVNSSAVLLIDPNMLKYFDFCLWSLFYNFLRINSSISVYLFGFKGFNIAEFINYVSLNYALPSYQNNIDCSFWFRNIFWKFQNSFPSEDGVKGFEYSEGTILDYPSKLVGGMDSTLFRNYTITFPSSQFFSTSYAADFSFPLSSFVDFESTFRGNLFVSSKVSSRISHITSGVGRFVGLIFNVLSFRSFDLVGCITRGVRGFDFAYGLWLILYFYFGCIWKGSFHFYKPEFEVSLPIRMFGFSEFRRFNYSISNYTVDFIKLDHFEKVEAPFTVDKSENVTFYRPIYLPSGLINSKNSDVFSDFGSRYLFTFLNFKKI